MICVLSTSENNHVYHEALLHESRELNIEHARSTGPYPELAALFMRRFRRKYKAW